MPRVACFLALLLPVLAVLSAAEPIGEVLTEPVDPAEVRTTWRNLANEQVIYPLSMSDVPVRLDSSHQLFLDNYLIAESDKVTRQVHEPTRHPNNPIFKASPAQFNHAVVQHVLKFEAAPRFRMWYWSWDNWQTLPSGQRIRHASSYAVSDDGVHWIRPELGLHEVEGLQGPNNVVVPYGMIQGVFYHPQASDPDQRFKALVCVERKNPVVREGYYLHTSPDGIRWRGDLSHPVLPSLLSTYYLPQGGVGDTSRFWWDPVRRKYVGDIKFVIYGTERARGTIESDDLVHWSRATPTFLARRSDETQIYGHRGFNYQGMYIGMRWIFVPARSQRHSTYVELDCSRDGRIWTRVGAGQPFMSFRDQHDTWDASIVRPVAMLEVGDEVWVYYFGAPTELESRHPNLPAHHKTDYALGLATLRRDRFVSINASDDVGLLITRPLNFTGDRLRVNAVVHEGGSIRVGVVDRDGRPMAGYESGRCTPLGGDEIDVPVSWAETDTLGGLQNSGVRLRFEMRRAQLFSFWID